MSTSDMIKLGSGILVIFLLVFCFAIVGDATYIQGNQLGVKEVWNPKKDADSTSLVVHPGMAVVFPGRIYSYQMSPNIFVMNDRVNDERANGRANDAYIARSSDNQDMIMWLALQWRFDPKKIAEIHRTYRSHIGLKDWDTVVEERLIRQIVMRSVNSEVTKYTAISAYSGEGFVRLQETIAQSLMDPDGELRQQGIIIENFVIEQIRLDDNYINEIRQRQVAQQRTLRAQEEEKAAIAEAAKAEAEARADYNRQVVTAERDKQMAVLQSEGAAQQQINAAKAEAEKVVLAANAEREAAIARAQAILAIGEAEAEAKKLQLSAFSVEGADVFVQIEVARSMSQAFQNIRGYLPESMKINLLSESFTRAIQSVVSPQTQPAAN